MQHYHLLPLVQLVSVSELLVVISKVGIVCETNFVDAWRLGVQDIVNHLVAMFQDLTW